MFVLSWLVFVPYHSFFSLIFSCWFFVYRLAIAGEGFVFPLNLVLLLHRAYSREDCSSLWDLRFVDDEEIHVFVLSVPFRGALIWSRPGLVDEWLLAIVSCLDLHLPLWRLRCLRFAVPSTSVILL